MSCRIVRIPRGMTQHIYDGGTGPAYVIDEDGNTILRREGQAVEVPAFSLKEQIPFEFWEPSEHIFKTIFTATIGRIQRITEALRITYARCSGGRPPDQMVLFLFQEPYVRELGLAKEDRIVSWNVHIEGPRARVLGAGTGGWVFGARFGLIARAANDPGEPGRFPFEGGSDLTIKGYRYGMNVEDLTPLVNGAVLDTFWGDEDEQRPTGATGGT